MVKMKEKEVSTIHLERNSIIYIKVIPGHFTTGNSHVNTYLDLSTLKSSAMVARDVARELAIPYLTTTMVDTILCMENMDVIGAYLAEELLEEGVSVINVNSEIHVVTPIINSHGKLIFQESVFAWIKDRTILLLVASISSGSTMNSALNCLAYYGGNVVGVSSLFLASQDWTEQQVHPLFTAEDIPGYEQYLPAQCRMCQEGHELDALISSEGYTKIAPR
jgi:orotate phosphoribosyltransferase